MASGESQYLSTPSPTPLRVCCYGSSSSKTPEPYLVEARSLGYTLARRGHTCVNGAGSCGCMAAMNDGASKGNGHIVGVIHEMFVVDGSDWADAPESGTHESFHDDRRTRNGPLREILVAGGDDLQERKRMLVEGADALVVLPGGPGTWDELWEMACARNLGLVDIPIVCVNVGGYYENFKSMLKRAHSDELIKLAPHEIVHFEPTAERAVRWIEEEAAVAARKKESESAASRKKIRRRESALRGSIFSAPMDWMGFSRSPSWIGGKLVGGVKESNDGTGSNIVHLAMTFAAGVIMGLTVATRIGSHSKY